MDALAQAKRAKWWVGAAIALLAAGFTAAATLGSLARASDVERIDNRLTAVEAHHADDDRLIDWLAQAVWSLRPAVPPPPPRQAR